MQHAAVVILLSLSGIESVSLCTPIHAARWSTGIDAYKLRCSFVIARHCHGTLSFHHSTSHLTKNRGITMIILWSLTDGLILPIFYIKRQMMRFSVNPMFPKVWITFVTKIVVAVYPWTGSCLDIVRRFMLKWQLSVSSCVYTVKLIPNTFKHWFKKMKRQQTNLRSSPDSEATGIKHTMVRRGTIVHKINELPCCRFHHIKWGCLLQNKKHKTFFVKNFTFLHLEDTRWNFHSGKTPHEK